MRPNNQSSPLRVFWFLIAATALALGAVGVFLPLLPTTPFIILAAFAFGKSVPAFQTKLEQSRLFGAAIQDWRASGAIAPRYKIMATGMMIAALGFGSVSSLPLAVKVLQVVLIVAAAIFVLSRPNSAKADLLTVGKHP